MTKQELIEMMNSWDKLLLTVQYVTENPKSFEVLMNVAMDDTVKHSWRASWMADKVHDQMPELFEPFILPVIDFLSKTKDKSKKREFLRLLCEHEIPEEKAGLMLDYCVEQFTNADEPIAVRVHAMQILYNISEKEPDLKLELIQIIEHEIEYHPSAGIKSRGSKLLKKLRKQILRNH